MLEGAGTDKQRPSSLLEEAESLSRKLKALKISLENLQAMLQVRPNAEQVCDICEYITFYYLLPKSLWLVIYVLQGTGAFQISFFISQIENICNIFVNAFFECRLSIESASLWCSF